MTFDNYCKVWNLDHIVPVFLFDLTKEDELKLCYNYQNIMPMYRKDNKYKGGSVHFSLELLKCKEQTPIVKALLERCQSEIDNRYNKYKPTS